MSIANSPIVWVSGVPLYMQLKEHLLRQIANGQWLRGDAIPTEVQLAQQYAVSISTVRAAIGALVEARILVRRAGRGTHVAARGGKEGVYSFFHLAPDRGERSLPVSEVLSLQRELAPVPVAQALQLPAQDKPWAWHIANVLRLQGNAVQSSDIWLPAGLFPKLTAARLNAANDTLYGAFQRLYGVTVVRTTDQIRAVIAPSAVAKALALPPGSPVLQMRRVAYTFNDQVMELRTMHIRTDAYHFLLEQGGT